MKLRMMVLALAAGLLAASCAIPGTVEERCERVFARFAKCKGLSATEERVRAQTEICIEDGFFAGDEGEGPYKAFMRLSCREVGATFPISLDELFPK